MSKSCQKVQKVVKKFKNLSKKCPKLVKVVKKLSKKCPKVVKKLSTKNLVKNLLFWSDCPEKKKKEKKKKKIGGS
jgi:hypothetical protein